MFSTKKRIAVKNDKIVASYKEYASGGYGPSSMSISTPGLGSNAKDGLLYGMIPDNEEALCEVYRDIYYHDAVCGSAVDLMSNLPFSDFTLTGLSDEQLSAFASSIDRLNMKSLFGPLSVDYLTLGKFVGTLIYNKEEKIFTDIIPHIPDHCQVISTPFNGIDPLIKVKLTGDIKQWLNSSEPYFQKIRKRLNQQMIQALQSSSITLDPVTTLYLPRKTFTVSNGTSIFKRVLPIYLLEKLLFKGTMTQATRRQKSIMHITMGDENWTPVDEEMRNIVQMFQTADLDPLGAIVATKPSVSVADVSNPSDFWKWTDLIDQCNGVKLKAMGISEGFLSGDSNFNCVVGSTLLTTENGIIPIQQAVDIKPEDNFIKSINFNVLGRTTPLTARTWHYNGVAPTLTVRTKTGNNVKGTAAHPLLVLRDGELLKVPLSEVKQTDFACLNIHPFTSEKPLPISIDTSSPLFKELKRVEKIPTEMTSDLAYLIGCVVARGYIYTNNPKQSVTIEIPCYYGLSDSFELAVRKVFGFNTQIDVTTDKDKIVCKVANQSIARLLEYYGVQNLTKYIREIPWSILQADKPCQLSFLAAFFNCLGYVKKSGGFRFVSYHKTILKQIQAMLNAMGVICFRNNKRVLIYPKDASLLGNDFNNRLLNRITFSDNARTYYGVPTKYLASKLDERRVDDNLYLDDNGNKISVSDTILKPFKKELFLYDVYDAGGYDECLDALKMISCKLHGWLINLLETRYMFTQVIAVKESGVHPVYDLSMNGTANDLISGETPYQEPFFTINGLVGGNTVEASLSVFLDNIRSYREMITHRTFYQKIFPAIAVVNNFYKKEEANTFGASSIQYEMNDTTKLLMPRLHWHKALRPEADQEYLTVLTTLAEQGVPVTLRAWAAAGGLNLDNLETSLKEDADLKAIIKKFGGGKSGGEEEGGGEDYGYEESSLNSNPYEPRKKKVAKRLRYRTLSESLSRDFGDESEVHQESKTGKKRMVTNQKEANERINKRIATALAKLSDENHFKNVLKKAKS